jgi:outer membrane protein
MFGLRGVSRVFMLGLPVLVAGTALAQVKVGIVDTQAALTATAEVKKAQADMELKYKARNDEFVKLQKELQELNQKLSMGDQLTPAAQAALSAQATRKQRDVQRIGEDLQSDVDRERNDLLTRTTANFKKVIDQLAVDRGLDVILDTGYTVYFKPTLDLTAEATAAYDKAYPAK